jgi:hypothetical protein
MDKCWFVLRQTHYPPPNPPSSPAERAKGAICLGHIIPSLKHLDQVINTSGPLPYPAGMPPYLTKKWNLRWDIHSGHNVEVNVKAEGLTSILPMDVKIDAGLVFKKLVQNYWQFEKLDTVIIQPTKAYIDDTLEGAQVAKFLEKKKILGLNSWTLLMISGLIIARGTNGTQHETDESRMHSNAGASMPNTADVGVGANVSSYSGIVEKYEKASDFVWAVRLTRIWKSLPSQSWKKETFVKGATFNLGQKEEKLVNIHEALKVEGMELTQDAELYPESDDDIFVLQEEGSEEDNKMKNGRAEDNRDQTT